MGRAAPGLVPSREAGIRAKAREQAARWVVVALANKMAANLGNVDENVALSGCALATPWHHVS